MKLKPKQQYLDVKISNLMTGRPTSLRFVETGLYPLYFKSFPWMFDEEKQIDANDLPKTKSK